MITWLQKSASFIANPFLTGTSQVFVNLPAKLNPALAVIPSSKKIAIISGHFMPEIGYQETYLARAYSRLGYSVRVFTSTAISPTGKKIISKNYSPGIEKEPKYGYEIERLPATINLNSKIISNGLAAKVRAYSPDYIIIIALAKLFPFKVLSTEFPSAKKIAVFGDADEYTDRTTQAKRVKAIFHGLVSKNIKKRLYSRAVKECDRIILNLRETDTFFKSFLNDNDLKQFENKKKNLTLGFDPDNFYFNSEERNEIRQQLNIPQDECVVITSTRVNRQKRLEEIINAISRIKEEGVRVHYIIIGFLGDEYENELKSYINHQKHPEIFHCLGFQSHETIRKFYAASDIGLWLKAAISIQEAMGTGLSIVLENTQVVSHLLNAGINGWYFEKNQLNGILSKAISQVSSQKPDEKLSNRQRIVKLNSEKFSYPTIAKEIIAGI